MLIVEELSLSPKETTVITNLVPQVHTQAASIYPTKQAQEMNAKDAGQQLAWDIIGVGEAMIDFSAHVDEEFLWQFNVEKGGRRVIGVEERTKVLKCLKDCSYKVSAGGSVSNTLVGLSQLGRALIHTRKNLQVSCNVAMAGLIGDDVLGQYFQHSMGQDGIKLLTPAKPNSSTGTVIVMTTADAQRTFLAFQGDSQLEVTQDNRQALQQSKLILIEGYLLEHAHSLEKILAIVSDAKRAGILTAVTAGDSGLVKRCRNAFKTIVEHGVDIFLANHSEAVAFLGLPQSTQADIAALELGKLCPISVVTDGVKGSHIYIKEQNKCFNIPPYWIESPLLDTTGAGDAYAAGLLFGVMMGLDLNFCGQLGSRMASTVIVQNGCRIDQQQVNEIFVQFVNSLNVSSGNFLGKQLKQVEIA